MKKILTLFLLFCLSTPCFAETVDTCQLFVNMDRQFRTVLHKPGVTPMDLALFVMGFLVNENNFNPGFSTPVRANLTKSIAELSQKPDNKKFIGLTPMEEDAIRTLMPSLEQQMQAAFYQIKNEPGLRRPMTTKEIQDFLAE